LCGGTSVASGRYAGGYRYRKPRKTTYVGSEANRDLIDQIRGIPDDKRRPGSFIHSILSQLERGRGLSQKQMAVVSKIILKHSEQVDDDPDTNNDGALDAEELDAMVDKIEDDLISEGMASAYADCFFDSDNTDNWSSTIDKNSNQIVKKQMRIKELTDRMAALSDMPTDGAAEEIAMIQKRIKSLRTSMQNNWTMLEKYRTKMTNHAINCEGGD
jgi:hypothetical protein